MKPRMSHVDEAEWLRRTAGVAILAEASVMRVRGDDARTWLQGQITNDVMLLSEGAACHALLLDAHGKIECELWAVRRDPDVWLVLPGTRSDAVRERLERYVVMEDVELERRDDLAVLTVQGPLAEQVKADDDATHAADRLGHGGFDRLVEKTGLADAFARWVERARALGGGAVSVDALELARIRAGRAALGREAGEHTLPQEAGLGGIAVSFQKGCYVGQEPVVMLEHRGKPPKRLTRVAIPRELVHVDGAPLTLDGQEVARLTSSTLDPESPTGALGLALVRRAHAIAGAVLQSAAGQVRILDVVENHK